MFSPVHLDIVTALDRTDYIPKYSSSEKTYANPQQTVQLQHEATESSLTSGACTCIADQSKSSESSGRNYQQMRELSEKEGENINSNLDHVQDFIDSLDAIEKS